MEEWSKLSTAWLLLWVGLGIFVLYVHNNVLPFIYLIYALGTAVAHLYFACTRCFYYDKMCYIFGGILSKKLFPARWQGPQDPDDSAVAAIWFILAVAPVPFLLYYQDWLLLIIYLIPAIGWFYNRRQTICVKCKNVWCPSKPK